MVVFSSGFDYSPLLLSETFPPDSLSQRQFTFTLFVIGDSVVEEEETLFLLALTSDVAFPDGNSGDLFSVTIPDSDCKLREGGRVEIGFGGEGGRRGKVNRKK